MKKLLIATFAVLAGGAAVDLARAAPVATPWSWTGFYVGGNVGYSWGNWDSTSVAAIFPGSPGFTTTDSPNVQGAVAGGQTGYNWQFAPQWLVGIEGDIDWSGEQASDSATASTSIHIPSTGFCNSHGPCTLTVTGMTTNTWNLDWFATIRGRLGWVADQIWLFYGTGGIAFAGAQFSNASSATATITGRGGAVEPGFPITTASAFSETTTRVGFAVGAGVEKMLSQSMSVKIEYLFMDFGSHTFLAGTGFDTNVRMIDNVIRGGVNWKF